ncbi:MAG: potassium transporter TrkA [Nitrospirales bacterium]|nr:MAG: potassium transporter TrkA [Nitrospirales bacterium]
MGAALSLFVLLTISVLVIRIASVALRLTGLEEPSAKFQALSAFSGTGFTTRESETIVNYPIRRRIISLMMVVGNLGLVSVFATLVASLVHTDGEVDAIVRQVAWLGGGLVLLWFFILNKSVERIMCRIIGRILNATTSLGKRHFHRLVQIGDRYSVCEHPVADAWIEATSSLNASGLEHLGLTVLAVRGASGEVTHNFSSTSELEPGDALVLYGCDSGHEALEHMSRSSEADRQTSNDAR